MFVIIIALVVVIVIVLIYLLTQANCKTKDQGDRG